ncbi:MAG: phage holin family protein [Bacteroidia bacterium]
MEADNSIGKHKIDKLLGHVVECAETRFDIVAINVQDKVTQILASMASIAVVFILLSFVVFLISIGVAIYLSQYFHNPFKGFLYVAAFYLVVSVVVIFTRNKLIKLPIINGLLKKINFHEED